MKIKTILTVALLSMVAFGCSSSKKIVANNPELDRLMTEQFFVFHVKTVEPQVTAALANVRNSGLMDLGDTTSRIDATADGYFLKLEGEQLVVDLPYYGERPVVVNLATGTGISLTNIANNLSITKDAIKKGYKITFSTKSQTENYNFTLTVAANLSGTLVVLSSQRDRIQYQGNLSTVKEVEEIQ